MFLYAIGTKGAKQKIGFSRDPEQRRKTLQTGNPEPLIVHYTFEIDDAKASKFETFVHKEYNHKRLTGEWFAMTPTEVIAAMTFQEIMKETTLSML